ncbi:hypothetical protein BOX15_Mlig022353g2, partial [Macrostomum lignano]
AGSAAQPQLRQDAAAAGGQSGRLHCVGHPGQAEEDPLRRCQRSQRAGGPDGRRASPARDGANAAADAANESATAGSSSRQSVEDADEDDNEEAAGDAASDPMASLQNDRPAHASSSQAATSAAVGISSVAGDAAATAAAAAVAAATAAATAVTSTGGRPQCPVCKCTFDQPSQLSLHLKTHQFASDTGALAAEVATASVADSAAPGIGDISDNPRPFAAWCARATSGCRATWQSTSGPSSTPRAC